VRAATDRRTRTLSGSLAMVLAALGVGLVCSNPSPSRISHSYFLPPFSQCGGLWAVAVAVRLPVSVLALIFSSCRRFRRFTIGRQGNVVTLFVFALVAAIAST